MQRTCPYLLPDTEMEHNQRRWHLAIAETIAERAARLPPLGSHLRSASFARVWLRPVEYLIRAAAVYHQGIPFPYGRIPQSVLETLRAGSLMPCPSSFEEQRDRAESAEQQSRQRALTEVEVDFLTTALGSSWTLAVGGAAEPDRLHGHDGAG